MKGEADAGYPEDEAVAEPREKPLSIANALDPNPAGLTQWTYPYVECIHCSYPNESLGREDVSLGSIRAGHASARPSR